VIQSSVINSSQAPNKQLQRTVMDKMPSHIRQRAAAEPGRFAPFVLFATAEG
jgi:hypothetical protein